MTHSEITDRILPELESGAPPWIRPWSKTPGLNWPCNAVSTAVVLCGVPLEIIEPTASKRYWYLPGKDKERARQKAIELFQSAHILVARKMDHGRAETALIALYGNRSSRRDRGVINSGQAGILGNLGCNTVKKANSYE